MSRTNIRGLFFSWYYVFVCLGLFFWLLAAVDVSFHPACMGSGAAGSASQTKRKKKVFIWCNGKETATMCATFCSLERSSATKHFDWTLLSNPALQTVPFFLSKTKHKGITPKIARISGCSIKEYPQSLAWRLYLFFISLSGLFWNRGGKKKPDWKTYHKCMEQTNIGRLIETIRVV